MSDEYQPRSADRILEILRSGDVNPRSWQREAADMLERLARRAAQAEGELDVLSISHRDLGKRLADAARVDSRKAPDMDALLSAIASCEAWIDSWTSHVGRCEGGDKCTCGRTAVLSEARAAIIE